MLQLIRRGRSPSRVSLHVELIDFDDFMDFDDFDEFIDFDDFDEFIDLSIFNEFQ